MYNYFYDGTPITKVQFEKNVPENWENDIENGGYSYGYFRATKIENENETFIELMENFEKAHRELSKFMYENDDDKFVDAFNAGYPFSQSFDDFDIERWKNTAINEIGQ